MAMPNFSGKKKKGLKELSEENFKEVKITTNDIDSEFKQETTETLAVEDGQETTKEELDARKLREIVRLSFLNKYVNIDEVKPTIKETLPDGTISEVENPNYEIFKGNEGVTDISYNGKDLFVQDNQIGRYKPSDAEQPTEKEIAKLMRQIASIQGKSFNVAEPILDTELAGLRINAVHRAVSPFGCTMALRVSRPYLAINDTSVLAKSPVIKLLEILMEADENLIISGITGSGKTELQKVLVGFIPQSRKITLIEDTMDSHIKALYPEKDINSWRTLLSDSRQKKITFTDLIKAGLRNNPDRLLISEIRGSDAYDFLESALTGHSVLTTIHADGAEAIPSRLRNMIGQDREVNPLLLGQDIVKHLRFGLHMEMTMNSEGKIIRRIREIVEFMDYTEKGVVFNNLYKVQKIYNPPTKEKPEGYYEEKYITNPVSIRTANALKNKEIYHKLPKIYQREYAEQLKQKKASPSPKKASPK